MTRSTLGLVACLALAACGGSTAPNDGGNTPPPPPPPELGPAEVTFAAPPTFKPADNTYLTMTAHVHNVGKAGVYQIEFWRWGSGSGAEDVLVGRTEQVEVAEGYDETAAWQVYSPISAPPIKYVLVFTRDQGSAQYRQTDRYDSH